MKLRSLILAFALVSSGAYAADMSGVNAINNAMAQTLPVKATPLLSNAYPYQSSGLFFGFYTEGGGGSVNATVPGINSSSLTTTDAGLGATLGYAWGSKTSQIAYSIEADFGVTNFNGSGAGLALSGPLSFEQRFVVWVPTSILTSLLPSWSSLFGTIPPFQPVQPGLTVSNLQSGFAGFLKERDFSDAFAGVQTGKVWLVEPGIKLLAMEQVSNGVALRAWAGIALQSDGRLFGPVPTVTTKLGPEYLVGFGAYF